MTTAVALIALFVICIGFAMLIANPNRFTNQIFAAGALLLSIELLVLNRSLEAGAQFVANGTGDPLFWVRASAALKVMFPWILWILGESIIYPQKKKFTLIARSSPWFIAGLSLGLATHTPWYIPSTSLPNNIAKGPGYIIISITTTLLWSLLIINSIKQTKNQSGIRKVEMQFLVINLSIAAFFTTSLFSAGHILSIEYYKYTAIFLVLIALSVTACGLTYYRIFNAKEVLLSFSQRTATIIFLYFTIRILEPCCTFLAPKPLDLISSLALAGSLTIWFDRSTYRWLSLGGEKSQTTIRKSAINIAKTEPNRDQLITRLEKFVKEQYRTGRVYFLFKLDTAYSSGDISVAKSTPAFNSLCEIGWATPESIDRRRSSCGLRDLGRSLHENGLGLLITIPRNSTEPSLLIALGSKEDESPYTYPEIERIQNLSELMDNLLIRSQLNAQLELQSRLEGLAIMSRGLAHDLKNLITPVSTFINSHECRRGPGAGGDTVFLAAQRSMRTITDYVEEAHFFSKQLVPRLEPVNPRTLLHEVMLALQTKAERESVFLELGPSTEETIQADRVLLQRLISNLLDNAIDASRAGGRVSLQARWTPEGQIKLAVVDSGAGISPEVLPRIFEPYFTTKDLGTGVRGFGLGLAISQKIVEIHGGKIGVRTCVGAGTTFEVSLPGGGNQPPQAILPKKTPGPAKSPALAFG